MNLAHPGWLALLLLVPLLGIGAALVFRLRRRQWDAFAAPRLRGRLIRRGSLIPRWLALIFLLAACVCLIGALARPQGDDGTRTETVLGRNVLIALDLSRSMRVTDVNPDRLSQAKVVIYELLESLPKDRVGLIGFAGQAHLFAPLTVDHSAIRETVEQIDETWTTVGGSNLAAALRLAIETLKETGQNNNALVILSDGEDNQDGGEIDTMISEAERSGVYIVSIGVGTDDGGFVPHPNYPDNRLLDRAGQPVLSRLQAEVLRKLANETGGRHAVAGSGADLPAIVTSAVREMDAFELHGRERRIVVEFYQWLVAPAILFLMLSIIAGTRWRGIRHAAAVLPFLAAGTFLAPRAAADDVKDAKAALEQGNFEKAQSSYGKLAGDTASTGRAARFRIGEGTAAYRSGDFRAARSAFSNAILSPDPETAAAGHFGLANTLFQLGWQGLSGERYPDGNPPDLEKFEELVLERLARMQEADLRDTGETEDFIRLDSLMVNWADAIRHYDSASAANPSDPKTAHNREVALAYLRKLREILEEEKNKAEQSMPQPMPGQGQPREGEEGEGSDGQGPNGNRRGQGRGGDEENDDGRGGDDSEEEDGKGKGGDDNDGDPNESPEDRARRILEENADLEKGPLGQGRHEFRNPEKDW